MTQFFPPFRHTRMLTKSPQPATGIEFAAELHDLITEDLSKVYPELIRHCRITVYDVAPQVLPMFDKRLSEYAMKTFHREGIVIKTSHHVERLRRGIPSTAARGAAGKPAVHNEHTYLTMHVKEEGEVGVGMVVWSTGLMMNPFVDKALGGRHGLSDVTREKIGFANKGSEEEEKWSVKRNPKMGGVLADDKLRLLTEEHVQEGNVKRVIPMEVCPV